ncbi:DNA repair protein RadC [Streptohalobacillus salinus]|uniref:DNA repair protein RadC n=1 Tax=Streptohalobacillus salinus TaxID=621096 RepID=A0A2V3W6T7_9BACI|nr:DNA repair protein RadC [Streptohalobacillus salinus]PXW90027.1 DNA repair protein RadC [Streptohalobacillus salinus]
MPELHVKMKDIPKNDRPRERLITCGPSHLSDQELLAIIIGSGTRNESVYDLAIRLYQYFGGIELLREATLEELVHIKGIGEVKAVSILAAIELGNRMGRFKKTDRYIIRCPEDGANYVMEDMRLLKQEHFVVLFLDTKNQIIHKQTVFIGSLNASIVHPREVVRPCSHLRNLSKIGEHSSQRSLTIQLTLTGNSKGTIAC